MVDKITENEAKQVYGEKKAKHEQELEKQRAAELEYVLADEDYNRANKRYRIAREAKDQAANAVYRTAYDATAAFIELGKIQIEAHGNVRG